MVSCDDTDDFHRRCAADRYPECSLFEEQASSCGLPAHRTQSLEVVFEFQLQAVKFIAGVGQFVVSNFPLNLIVFDGKEIRTRF